VGTRFSAPVQTVPGAHPASCTMGTGSFPGVKRPGRDADPSPSSSSGQERVELYLYSPYGPYGLYRASVPVQRCTLPFTFSLVPCAWGRYYDPCMNLLPPSRPEDQPKYLRRIYQTTRGHTSKPCSICTCLQYEDGFLQVVFGNDQCLISHAEETNACSVLYRVRQK